MAGTTITEELTIGEALISALVAGEHDAAAQLLAPTVHFRGLTPRAFRDASTRGDAMAILAEWFPLGDVESLLSLDHGRVGERQRVGYRVRWWSPERELLQFEQQAYYDAGPDGITWMSLVCSGDCPADAATDDAATDDAAPAGGTSSSGAGIGA